ncbi:MAG: hypothetical protein QOE65_328 [Solirubrobacteraceae bacterium]|jgi:hypothetical protein|nr:hypothetical protein [Solirubrobacteraceae bacterium]
MRRTLGSLMVAAAVAAGTLAPGASAAGPRFEFAFADTAPGRATTGQVHVVFPTDAQGRPRRLAGLDFKFPVGTEIDRGVAPVCGATDDEIDRSGAGACPAATQVGHGEATAATGFGAPVDPFPSDAHTFNTRSGTVNVFTPPGLAAPAVWRTRQRYEGLWVRDEFPPPPAGFPPPDGRSLPLEARFTLDRRSGARSWLTTPAGCPAGGTWTARVVLTYAAGGSDTARATTPCTRPAANRPSRARRRVCRRANRRHGRGRHRACRRGARR